MAFFSQLSRCLWCIWPCLIIGIAWFVFFRGIDGKTYYAGLSVGKDPLAPENQAEFETTRQRDADKRKVIFWCVGIIVFGYVVALLWNTFTIKAKAIAPQATETLQTITSTQAVWTQVNSSTMTFFPTRDLSTPTPTATYAPTATARIVYQAGPVQVITVIVERQIPVVITQVVTVEVTRVVTVTPSYTPTLTETPSATPTPTPTTMLEP
jgi:cytoskeletal protein RodZ